MFSECNNMWNELQIKQIREIIEKEALDFFSDHVDYDFDRTQEAKEKFPEDYWKWIDLLILAKDSMISEHYSFDELQCWAYPKKPIYDIIFSSVS